jgi:hypothetical protein
MTYFSSFKKLTKHKKMPIQNKRKGIYCLEAPWDHKNIQDRASVLPMLDLLKNTGHCDYIFHDSATKEELEFYLEKWGSKKINVKYPILYLAFHGESGCIRLSGRTKYNLEDLSNFLENKCIGKIIYFGSCSTLNLDKRVIKKFLEKTGAIAVIGYQNDVDWIQSAACDLFVFEALQKDKLDSKGIDKIHKMIISNYGNLHKKLDLRVVINDRQHFRRRRK